MENFVIGQDVEVRFMGTITEIGLNTRKEIVYKVDDGMGQPIALMLKESDLCRLPEPADLGVNI